MTGLEPAASASRTQRSTKLSHISQYSFFRSNSVSQQLWKCKRKFKKMQTRRLRGVSPPSKKQKYSRPVTCRAGFRMRTTGQRNCSLVTSLPLSPVTINYVQVFIVLCDYVFHNKFKINAVTWRYVDSAFIYV